jgi:triosephosphate isomerase
MKKIIAANWKMHKTQGEARTTAAALISAVPVLPEDREVIIFPPFTALTACVEGLGGRAGFFVGGQNIYPADKGAFTGEISLSMLRDCGCTHVLVGHSERRALLKESNTFIGGKTSFALKHDLKVMLCIGETLVEREQGNLEAVLNEQLTKALADVKDDINPEELLIAYEPVWAIGTGKVAGETEIFEAHALIRRLLVRHFPQQGKVLRILYGGSVKEESAKDILALDNVEGVLVGGASLEAGPFSRIVLA